MAGTRIHRMTRQRQLILDELTKLKSHPTAEEVCRIVRKKLPSISLATVYRNLDILAGCGTIQKIEAAGAQKRFDADTGDHYHLRCVDCGRVFDTRMKPIKAIKEAMKNVRNCKILRYRLEFIGLCQECKK